MSNTKVSISGQSCGERRVERCSGRCAPIHFGMHLFDAHQQRLGTVVLARDDYFVMRQELGICQLVAVPMVAVAGVVGSLVLLTLTPGEIELYCRTLERKDRRAEDWRLLPRLHHVPESAWQAERR